MHTIAGSDYHAFPVLLLAAGASRRMGRPKALLKFNDGTLMDHAVSQAKQLGANDEASAARRRRTHRHT